MVVAEVDTSSELELTGRTCPIVSPDFRVVLNIFSSHEDTCCCFLRHISIYDVSVLIQ